MKNLINIITISFICLTFIHCQKASVRAPGIEGTWKHHYSYSETDTIRYNDLRGVKITPMKFCDCNFINQFSPFMCYDYTHIDGVLNISEGKYMFNAYILDDCLIFEHDNGYKNIFIPYTKEEIILVENNGCFQ